MYPDEQPSGTEPGRGRLIAIFGGLAGLGLLIGVGAAQLTESGPDPDVIGAIAATAPAGTPAQSSFPEAGSGSTATPGPTTSTGTPDYRSIPEDAAASAGLDFGYLTRVVSIGGTVTLRFDRASFYTGDEAKQHNNGQAPENDYLIDNTNPAQRDFVLDPRASIIAVNRLRDQPGSTSQPGSTTQPGSTGREILTVAEFVANAQRVLTGTTTDLPVWLRHTDGLSGNVTALAEQYLP